MSRSGAILPNSNASVTTSVSTDACLRNDVVQANDWTVGRVELVSPSELCGELATCWDRVRAQSPCFESPYFDIEFTKAVARVRDDIEIAIVEDHESKIRCFFPFQRIKKNRAAPVGGKLNDVQSLIGLPDDPHAVMLKVLKAAKLKSYQFHAGLRLGESFEQNEFQAIDSHHLDLSMGWDGYFAWAKKNSVTIKRQGQKTRALGRQVGDVRFEYDCQSGEVLNRLIEMKREKYQRSKTFDILSVEWASQLLREIAQVQTSSMKGILSVLWAGDDLVAVHFGMLTNDILHYWFPVFDPQYSRFSPGTELMLSVAREASSNGVTKVDLGYGDDAYKFKFANGRDQLSCGRVTTSSLDFEVAKCRYRVRKKLKDIPMKPLAKTVLRRVFPGFGQWNFK